MNLRRVLSMPRRKMGCLFLRQKCKRESVSCSIMYNSATPWTAARQAPPSMGFSRQEYWSGLPFSPGDLSHPGIKPRSPALQADSLPSDPPIIFFTNLFRSWPRKPKWACWYGATSERRQEDSSPLCKLEPLLCLYTSTKAIITR